MYALKLHGVEVIYERWEEGQWYDVNQIVFRDNNIEERADVWYACQQFKLMFGGDRHSRIT
jgi:hypothetical protein